MEYKLSTGSGWTTINANPLMGLTDGTYEVRVKASGTVLASIAVTVTIGAHTCVVQGDWQYNGTDHWSSVFAALRLRKLPTPAAKRPVRLWRFAKPACRLTAY